MQIVNTGHIYQIYDDGVKTFNQLPAQVYNVSFSKMTGFFLQKFDDIEITEKVYGVATEKLDKVVKSFEIFERNLGVILSGEKGIGKSLFAKMLSEEMVSRGYPVLIVNQFIPGIADFLTSSQQEVVVLFDEFDKTFYSKDGDSMDDPQSSMLTLFDGLSQGKKMFIVTCNKLNHLNDYLVNRPGRFHYHFRFEYPTSEEITEYLRDKISEEYFNEIPKVVSFANKVSLNYDCLRAIAFELESGTPFEIAIRDLNILNIQKEQYIISAVFSDGSIYRDETMLDMFSDNDISRVIYVNPSRDFRFKITFNPLDAEFDYSKGKQIVRASDVDFEWEEWYVDSEDKEDFHKLTEIKKFEYLTLTRKSDRILHYAL